MKKAIAKAAAVIMSAMLAIQTAAVCMPLTVYAAANDGSSKMSLKMKEALKVAEERVDIPEELSVMDSSVKKTMYGITLYEFTWHTPSAAKEYKSIKVSVSGNIIFLYDSGIPENKTDEPRFAKLTEEQLIEKAKGYAKQLNPTIYKKMKFGSADLKLRSDTASVGFRRYENGIEVVTNDGVVKLDKNTGELLSFQCYWWEKVKLPDPDRAKSPDKIEKFYRKHSTLTPYYRIDAEYNKQIKKLEYKARLVYDFSAGGEVDAITGRYSEYFDRMLHSDGLYCSGYYSFFNYTSNNAGSDASEDSEDGGEDETDEQVSFTKSELEKIEEAENPVKLLSDEELFEILKKNKAVALDDNYRLDHRTDDSIRNNDGIYESYLRYELDEDASDRYEEVYVTVNGETGEILNFSKDDFRSDEKLPKIDNEKAAAAADEALKYLAKDIAPQYKMDKESFDEKPWSWDYKKYKYNRYVNGILVDPDGPWQQDYISITVDSLGNVISYYNEHKDVEYFPPADMIPKEEILEKVFAGQKYECYYIGWTDRDSGMIFTYLLYNTDDYYFNANTGERCNFDGSELQYYDDPWYADYGDIKGIPQEKAILALQSYSVGVTAKDKFDPNAVITEEEFASLLYSVFGKKAAAAEKALQEYETDGKTTREEAAVMFAKMYDPNGIAGLKDTFKTPFGDVKSTDENVGYIAIAYAKGFISKSADGKLNGGKNITRAEAEQMLYDYIKLISK